MTIANRISAIMKSSTDAKTIFNMLLEISVEYKKDLFHIMSIAFCDLDPVNDQKFYKEFVIVYLKYEAKICYQSTILKSDDGEQNFSNSINTSVLEMCIFNFFAFQKNFYFIHDLNALNILEKEFLNEKTEYINTFSKCVDFFNSKNISSNLEVLSKIKVLQF